MSTRTSAWLAWSLGGLSLVMFVASFVLYILLLAAQVPGSRPLRRRPFGRWPLPGLPSGRSPSRLQASRKRRSSVVCNEVDGFEDGRVHIGVRCTV
jgi:hypothetical protein